jgi:transcriptional regulator with XRE-family HTH domain
VTLSSSALDPEATPRGKLAKHLRLVRQAAGFTTQLPLAKRLGVSADLVSKIETGKHIPPQDVFLAWLDVCQVSEEARGYITDIWVLARNSKSAIPAFAVPWLNAEAECDYLRFWSFVLAPGPLQTYDYAYNMFLLGDLDEETATERATARVERRRHVEGSDAKRVTAILHESVLYCRVGPDEVMVGQLEDLLAASRLPNVIIQVVPDTGYFFGLDGEFYLASGREIADTLTMITVEDWTTTEPARVDRSASLFERIRGHALPIEDSRAKIQEALQRWNGQQ